MSQQESNLPKRSEGEDTIIPLPEVQLLTGGESRSKLIVVTAVSGEHGLEVFELPEGIALEDIEFTTSVESVETSIRNKANKPKALINPNTIIGVFNNDA